MRIYNLCILSALFAAAAYAAPITCANNLNSIRTQTGADANTCVFSVGSNNYTAVFGGILQDGASMSVAQATAMNVSFATLLNPSEVGLRFTDANFNVTANRNFSVTFTVTPAGAFQYTRGITGVIGQTVTGTANQSVTETVQNSVPATVGTVVATVPAGSPAGTTIQNTGNLSGAFTGVFTLTAVFQENATNGTNASNATAFEAGVLTPEPGTVTMLGLGAVAIGLGSLRNRRKKLSA